MAEIIIDDLIKIIKESPKYIKDWEKEISTDQALYIRFLEKDEIISSLNSNVYALKNGRELVIDSDENGVIYGIEII